MILFCRTNFCWLFLIFGWAFFFSLTRLFFRKFWETANECIYALRPFIHSFSILMLHFNRSVIDALLFLGCCPHYCLFVRKWSAWCCYVCIYVYVTCHLAIEVRHLCLSLSLSLSLSLMVNANWTFLRLASASSFPLPCLSHSLCIYAMYASIHFFFCCARAWLPIQWFVVHSKVYRVVGILNEWIRDTVTLANWPFSSIRQWWWLWIN